MAIGDGAPDHVLRGKVESAGGSARLRVVTTRALQYHAAGRGVETGRLDAERGGQVDPTDTDATPADGPMKDLMHSFMAIKRHGSADEVAGMVAWLAGPEAGFVTGVMHTIDGAFGA